MLPTDSFAFPPNGLPLKINHMILIPLNEGAFRDVLESGHPEYYDKATKFENPH